MNAPLATAATGYTSARGLPTVDRQFEELFNGVDDLIKRVADTENPGNSQDQGQGTCLDGGGQSACKEFSPAGTPAIARFTLRRTPSTRIIPARPSASRCWSGSGLGTSLCQCSREDTRTFPTSVRSSRQVRARRSCDRPCRRKPGILVVVHGGTRPALRSPARPGCTAFTPGAWRSTPDVHPHLDLRPSVNGVATAEPASAAFSLRAAPAIIGCAASGCAAAFRASGLGAERAPAARVPSRAGGIRAARAPRGIAPCPPLGE